MPRPTLITQKEYAKRIGKTPQYVNKLVAQGKIVLKRGLVDPKQADAARRAWARPGREPKPAHRSPAKAKAPARKTIKARYATGTRPGSAGESLTWARARREIAQADMAEMELKLKLGALLPRDQVLAAERKKNERIRTRFRRLPRAIAPLLAREMTPAEVEQVLRDEIDLLLSELAGDPLGLKDEVPVLAPQTSATVEGMV